MIYDSIITNYDNTLLFIYFVLLYMVLVAVMIRLTGFLSVPEHQNYPANYSPEYLHDETRQSF